MLRILLTGGHPRVRQALRSFLEELPGGAMVSEAAGVAEALELLAADDWDLVVLDISLHGPEGVQALQLIKAEHPGVPAIVVVGQAAAQLARASLLAGASGCVRLDRASGELARTIRSVLP